MQLCVHRFQLNVHLQFQGQVTLLKSEDSNIDALGRLQRHCIDKGMKTSQRYHIQIEIDSAVFEEQGRANEITHMRDGEVLDQFFALRSIQPSQRRPSVDLLFVEMKEMHVRIALEMPVRAMFSVDVLITHQNEDRTILVETCR